MNKNAFEVNFDGIVGPTHNYSGLSYGNVASLDNKQAPSNPKQAALQGLEKMKFLADLGIKQAVLPPQERPHLPTLRMLGFSGSDAEVIQQAVKVAPDIYIACCSASCMWTANAATISPSSDSKDKKVHISPANLTHKFHRSIEYPITTAVLRKIFPEEKYFVHHPILPAGNYFSDEGAANHTRFCQEFHKPGVQLFVYGRIASQEKSVTEIYPARQTLEASQAIIRRHQLDPKKVVLARQNPCAIDAGVFHNDVISVGHQNVFLYHTEAFDHTDAVVSEIRQKVKSVCGTELYLIPVPASKVSLSEAVSSYLFNSQILTLPNGNLLLAAPSECQQTPAVEHFISEMIRDKSNPINTVHYFNLRESMRNGGGPACLRLRVALTADELRHVHPNVLLNDELYSKLTAWVNKHYRDNLTPRDLADPSLLYEVRQALDELTSLLQLGSVYDFQR